MSSLLQRFLRSSRVPMFPRSILYSSRSLASSTPLISHSQLGARCANHPTVIEVPVEMARYWLLTGQRNSLLREPTRLCPPSFLFFLFLPPPAVAFQFPDVLLATKFNHRPNFSSSFASSSPFYFVIVGSSPLLSLPFLGYRLLLDGEVSSTTRTRLERSDNKYSGSRKYP